MTAWLQYPALTDFDGPSLQRTTAQAQGQLALSTLSRRHWRRRSATAAHLLNNRKEGALPVIQC